MKALWIIYLIYAAVAGCAGLAAFMGARSAPQEEVAAAVSLAAVAIPYLIVRAVQHLADMKAADAARIRENIREAKAANPAPSLAQS